MRQYRSISLNLEKWMDELLTLKAKNMEMSKSELVRILIKNALVCIPQKNPENPGYFNDPKGILRSVKKIKEEEK